MRKICNLRLKKKSEFWKSSIYHHVLDGVLSGAFLMRLMVMLINMAPGCHTVKCVSIWKCYIAR